MKKRILKMSFALIAIVGVSAVTSCKKGENDPLLSLKSRKARISGEWKLGSGIISESETDLGVTETDVTTFTGSTASSDGFTYPYSETLTIEKDGTYENVIVDDSGTSTAKGNWYFSGKVKDLDLKNKEGIVFSQTQYISSNGNVSTYSGLLGDEILMIDQLKNKEMIFKGTITYADNDDYSASLSYDRTFDKQ